MAQDYPYHNYEQPDADRIMNSLTLDEWEDLFRLFRQLPSDIVEPRGLLAIRYDYLANTIDTTVYSDWVRQQHESSRDAFRIAGGLPLQDAHTDLSGLVENYL